MDFVSNLLSNNGFIMVNKTLIHTLGLHEAIILGELCSEYNYWKIKEKLIDNMFYSTRENIEKNTGLSPHYQRNAMKTLIDKGILTVIKKGCPAINYYRLDFTKLSMLLTTTSSHDECLGINPVNINKNNKKNKENKSFTKVNDGDHSPTDYDFIKSNITKDDIVKSDSDIEEDNTVNNDFLGSIKKKDEEKPVKKKAQSSFKDIVNDYTDNKDLKEAIWSYITAFNERCKTENKRGMMPNVLKGQLKQLTLMAKDDEHKIRIMYYSTGYYRPYDPDSKSTKGYKKFDVLDDCGQSDKANTKLVNGKLNNRKELDEIDESIIF